MRRRSLCAARLNWRWKRPRRRTFSSLSEDGMERLRSSSRDRSLSESESWSAGTWCMWERLPVAGPGRQNNPNGDHPQCPSLGSSLHLLPWPYHQVPVRGAWLHLTAPPHKAVANSRKIPFASCSFRLSKPPSLSLCLPVPHPSPSREWPRLVSLQRVKCLCCTGEPSVPRDPVTAYAPGLASSLSSPQRLDMPFATCLGGGCAK